MSARTPPPIFSSCTDPSSFISSASFTVLNGACWTREGICDFSNDSTADSTGGSATRVSRACGHCKKAKARCDLWRPCNRCVRSGRGESCVDSVPQKRGRKRAVSAESEQRHHPSLIHSCPTHSSDAFPHFMLSSAHHPFQPTQPSSAPPSPWTAPTGVFPTVLSPNTQSVTNGHLAHPTAASTPAVQPPPRFTPSLLPHLSLPPSAFQPGSTHALLPMTTRTTSTATVDSLPTAMSGAMSETKMIWQYNGPLRGVYSTVSLHPQAMCSSGASQMINPPRQQQDAPLPYTAFTSSARITLPDADTLSRTSSLPAVSASHTLSTAPPQPPLPPSTTGRRFSSLGLYPGMPPTEYVPFRGAAELPIYGVHQPIPMQPPPHSIASGSFSPSSIYLTSRTSSPFTAVAATNPVQQSTYSATFTQQAPDQPTPPSLWYMHAPAMPHAQHPQCGTQWWTHSTVNQYCSISQQHRRPL
jgi:hypothetical protein